MYLLYDGIRALLCVICIYTHTYECTWLDALLERAYIYRLSVYILYGSPNSCPLHAYILYVIINNLLSGEKGSVIYVTARERTGYRAVLRRECCDAVAP